MRAATHENTTMSRNCSAARAQALSRETAFLYIDRKGQRQGHTATFVFRATLRSKIDFYLREYPRRIGFAIVFDDFQHAFMCF